MKKIGSHIVNKLDLQDIVDLLSEKLSGSELSSVLLDVFDRRIEQETPDRQNLLIASTVSFIEDRNKRAFQVLVVEPDHENNYYNGYRIKLKVALLSDYQFSA